MSSMNPSPEQGGRNNSAARKSNKGMLIAIIAGAAAVVGLICLGVCGAVGYFFVNFSQQVAEEVKRQQAAKVRKSAPPGVIDNRKKGPVYVLSKEDRLHPSDPKAPGSPGPTKTYQVNLKQGKTYHIEMNREGPSKLNPYLRVLDSQGKELAKKYHPAGNLNVRLDFTPSHTGQYRVQAATNPKGPLGSLGPEGGGYRLTVREK